MKILTVFIIYLLTECGGRIIRSGDENTQLLPRQSYDASRDMSGSVLPNPGLGDEKTYTSPSKDGNSNSGELLAKNTNGRKPSNIMPATGLVDKSMDTPDSSIQEDQNGSEAEITTLEQKSMVKQNEKTEIVHPESNSNSQNNKSVVKSEPRILLSNQNTNTTPVTSYTETKNTIENGEGMKLKDKPNVIIPSRETIIEKSNPINTETENSDIEGEGTKLHDIHNILMPGPVISKQNTDSVPIKTEGNISDNSEDGLKLEDIPNIMMPGPVIINEESKKVSPSDAETSSSGNRVLSPAKDAGETASLISDKDMTNKYKEELPLATTKNNKDEPVSKIPSKDATSSVMKDAKTDTAPTQAQTSEKSLLEDGALSSGEKNGNSNVLMPGPINEKTENPPTSNGMNNSTQSIEKSMQSGQTPSKVADSDLKSENPLTKLSPTIQKDENQSNFVKDKTLSQLPPKSDENKDMNTEIQKSSSIQINSGIGNQLHGENGKENRPIGTSVPKEDNFTSDGSKGVQSSETDNKGINEVNPVTSGDKLNDAKNDNNKPRPGDDAVTGSIDQVDDDNHVSDDDDDISDDNVYSKNVDHDDSDNVDYDYTDDYDESWWEESDDNYPDDDDANNDDDDQTDQNYSDESVVDLDDIAEEEDDDDEDDGYITNDDFDKDEDDDKFSEIITNVKTHAGDDINDNGETEEYVDDEDDLHDDDNEGTVIDNKDKFDTFKDIPIYNDDDAESDDDIFDDDDDDAASDDDDDGDDDDDYDYDDFGDDDDNGEFDNEIEDSPKDDSVFGAKDDKKPGVINNTDLELDEDGTSDVDDTDLDSESDAGYIKSSKHSKIGAKYRDDKKWREITSEVKRASTYSWVLFFAVIVITLLFVAYLNKSKVSKFFAPAASPRRKLGDEEKNLLAHEYD